MHRQIRVALATAAAAALTGGLMGLTATTATADDAPAVVQDQADFNNDGYADVAASADRATANGKSAAGAVGVIYGGASANRYATITQSSAGVPGTPEKKDFFGADTAYGDFDNDGYDDLLVGAPGEDVGSDVDGGTAVILWGSASGLRGGTTVHDPRPAKHDGFGAPLQAGDFNGDGKDDIAAGSTGGAVTIDVLNGGFTRGGATGGHSTVTTPVVSGDGVQNLHSGDANGDGVEDLIINGYAPEDGYDANYWVPGTAQGLDISSAQKLAAGIITDLGDTNGDGYDDIVIGNSWDDGIEGASTGGSAYVVQGSANGPAYGFTEKFSQTTAGVPGSSETDDAFGAELDLGDVNGDGHLDLAVGTPGEDLPGGTDAGAVTVLYGAADGSGITGEGAKAFNQDTAGVPNTSEPYDYFGGEVRLDDLNHDGRDDLVVGAYGENSGNGAVYPLRAAAGGTTFSAPSGIYVSTVGIDGAGTPIFSHNFAD